MVHEHCEGSPSRARHDEPGEPTRLDEQRACTSFDLDGDGKAEAYRYRDAEGRTRRREIDFDLDGDIDQIEHHEAGVLVRR